MKKPKHKLGDVIVLKKDNKQVIIVWANWVVDAWVYGWVRESHNSHLNFREKDVAYNLTTNSE